MKVETSQVTKLVISGVDDLDPLHVFLEDFGPARGKITITCFDECWTNFWGAMGAGRDIRAFFCSCDVHYLAGKLATGLNAEVDDLGKLADEAKKHVIESRRDRSCCVSKDKARELFDLANDLETLHDEDPTGYRDAMFNIFGDEWRCDVPQKPNHQYEYLCRIVNTVKAALQEAS